MKTGNTPDAGKKEAISVHVWVCSAPVCMNVIYIYIDDISMTHRDISIVSVCMCDIGSMNVNSKEKLISDD